MAKRKTHLTFENRVKIQFEIDNNPRCSLASLSKIVNCNRSTLYREIKNNCTYEKGKFRLFRHSLELECEILKHFPYVCNGCTHKNCIKDHYFYNAYQAENSSKEYLHNARRHPYISTSELKKVDETISPRVCKGQSLYHILTTSNLSVSESTLRRYITKGYMTCRDIDLPRKVRFTPQKQYRRNRKRIEIALLCGRMYTDFLNILQTNPVVLEIDTVFGKIDDEKCILTLYERKSKLQWGYLIKQTKAQVNSAIEKLMERLKEACNGNLFFNVILMDNGSEFEDVPKLELDDDGVLNFRSFFCDPYCSGQKGGCERNHEFIRYMYKKGESIATLTPEKLNNLFSQINSIKRRSLNGRSSYEVFIESYGYHIIEIIGIFEVKPKEISFKKIK